MENKKDIGEAFREKLNQMDRSPDDMLWTAIEADLDKKKKRRLLPFWFILGTIAVLGVSILVFNAIKETSKANTINTISGEIHGKGDASASSNAAKDKSRTTDHEENSNTRSSKTDSINSSSELKSGNGQPLTSEEKDPRNETENKILVSGEAKQSFRKTSKGIKNQSLPDKIKAQENQLLVLSKYSKNNKIGSYRSDRKKSIGEKPSTENIVKTQHSNSQNNIPKKDEIIITEGQAAMLTSVPNEIKSDNPEKTDSIKANIEKKELPIEEKPKTTQKDSSKLKNEFKKLSLFLYGAPTTMGYFSSKSPLDRRLNANAKKFEPTLSYGAYAIYEATEGWSLRFGVSIMNLHMETKDAIVNTNDYDYIVYSKANNASIYALSNAKTMNIIQEISYTEVPIELKYAITRRRFGVNAYGGLSALFIGKNKLSAKAANGMRFEMGKTKNLASNSYTLTAGIGIDYKFAKNIRFNLEPVFKYHLLDYKDVGVRPYSIGILTGLQFSLK